MNITVLAYVSDDLDGIVEVPYERMGSHQDLGLYLTREIRKHLNDPNATIKKVRLVVNGVMIETNGFSEAWDFCETMIIHDMKELPAYYLKRKTAHDFMRTLLVEYLDCYYGEFENDDELFLDIVASNQDMINPSWVKYLDKTKILADYEKHLFRVNNTVFTKKGMRF